MNERFYLKEFQLWDGEKFITFNMLDLSDMKVKVAVVNEGKISVYEYDLFEDEQGLYFEYGVNYTRINIKDFEEVDDL